MSRAEQIEQSAAIWLVRREDPEWSSANEYEFQAWMSESDAHKAAYWRLLEGWDAADRIGALGLPAVERQPGFVARFRAPIALAASLVMVFSAFVLTADGMLQIGPQTPQMASVETAVGARKVVNLSDGSRVELNTASRLRAELGSGRRAVWLDKGEAYFDVAKKDGFPFVVYAGTRQITVLGTKFGVRLIGGEVVVSVAEGRVRIEDTRPGASIQSTTIGAGDVAIAQGESILISASAGEAVQERLAWRQDVLVFDDTPLREAVGEFNRYNRRQLVIDDPALAGMRIGGSFNSKNVDAFVRLLQDAYGVRVEGDADQTRISA